MIDIEYDLDGVTLDVDINPLKRYAPLLPLRDVDTAVWLGEGNTPTVHAERLGRACGLDQLWLKDETKNPTKTTKDRMATVGLAFLIELGINEIVMNSTGNSSTAYARAASLCSGFRLHVFVGQEFGDRLNFISKPDIHVYVVAGSFVQAGIVARRFARERGLTWEGGFFNPARREGLKLAYLEAFDAMADDAPQVVIQAISSGMGLYGGYRGAQQYLTMGRLVEMPRFFAAQQASCAPMVAAFREGAESIDDRFRVRHPQGVAKAILRGDPTATYGVMKRVVTETDGGMIDINDDEILWAQQLAYSTEGISICPAAAVALAGAIRLRREGQVECSTRVLVNLTGGERPIYPVPSAFDLVTLDAFSSAVPITPVSPPLVEALS